MANFGRCPNCGDAIFFRIKKSITGGSVCPSCGTLVGGKKIEMILAAGVWLALLVYFISVPEKTTLEKSCAVLLAYFSYLTVSFFCGYKRIDVGGNKK